jgi:ABC-type multidrug transport system fused ATPase/permease subunit
MNENIQVNQKRFHPFSISFLQTEELKTIKDDLAFAIPWFKPYKKRFFIILVFFLFSLIAGLGLPRVIASLIDKSSFEKEHLLLLYVTIVLFKVVTDYIYKYYTSILGNTVSLNLRNAFYQKLLNLPQSTIDKYHSSYMTSRVVHDLTSLSAFFSINVFTLIADFLFIFGSIFLISFLSLPIMFLNLCLTSLMLLYVFNVTIFQWKLGQDLRSINARGSQLISDSLLNLEIINTKNPINKLFERQKKLKSILMKMMTKGVYNWGFFSSSHVISMGIGISLSIYLAIYFKFSMGQVVALSSYLMMIYHPLMDFSEKANNILVSLSSAKRCREFFNNNIDSEENLIIPHKPCGAIVFKNINFQYKSDVSVLDNFNITIQENKITAIVGRTGSGKSTLFNLFLGHYTQTSGQIFWGEQNLNLVSFAWKKKHIALINQELNIMNENVRENLRFFEPIEDAEIWKVLELVGLKSKIASLQHGLDTNLRLEDLPFSHGEKQVFILAQAMLKKPRLVLCDEATSYLDTKSELNLMENIQNYFPNSTIIMIAHRLKTLSHVDEIIVLDNGKIKKTINNSQRQHFTHADLQ